MSAFFCSPLTHHHAEMGYFVSADATLILHPIPSHTPLWMSPVHCPPVPVVCPGVNSTLFSPQPARPLATLSPVFLPFRVPPAMHLHPLFSRYQVTEIISFSVPGLGHCHPGWFLELCGTKCMLSRVGRSTQPSLPHGPPVSQFQGVQSTPWS